MIKMLTVNTIPLTKPSPSSPVKSVSVITDGEIKNHDEV